MSNPELPIKVGVMGVGALGGDVLTKLDGLGFEVIGFGFSEKKTFPILTFKKSTGRIPFPG